MADNASHQIQAFMTSQGGKEEAGIAFFPWKTIDYI